ncbi:MAG TPA: radical SAM protein [Armatimonadota bacterium]|nr:radical SAM protein [Armatimonadota bacterium]
MDVILHLTQDCQLACVYCYGGRKRACAMAWDTARRAIDLLFDHSSAEMPSKLTFFGGEPLLELPLLKRCVDYAKARRADTGHPLRLEVATNGLAADAATIEYCLSQEMEVTLSFDGVAAAQDATRRYGNGGSSFADTQAAMHRLLPHFPELAICAVVSPENVQYLPLSIDFFLAAGVRRLMLNPNFFARWGDSQLDLWRRGYEHAAGRFIEEYRCGRAVNVGFITAKVVTHLKGGYDLCDCCDFGQKEIAVAPSGNIYPCQRMVGEDVGELGLMGDVFTGMNQAVCEQLADARQARNPECLQCDLRRRCRNWCSCVNHRLTGRFDCTGPLVCFHERMAIAIADRTASQLFRENNPTFLQTFYPETPISPEWL